MTPLLDSGFRRSDEFGKTRFFVVIPAKAEIQDPVDHEKSLMFIDPR
jgi:hypothetical protein